MKKMNKCQTIKLTNETKTRISESTTIAVIDRRAANAEAGEPESTAAAAAAAAAAAIEAHSLHSLPASQPTARPPHQTHTPPHLPSARPAATPNDSIVAQ